MTNLSGRDSDKSTALAPPQASTRYVWGAMLILLAVNTLNFMDRQIINILAEPIKQDLGLADWQIGAMSGLAFAFVYSTFGVPISRLSERTNRSLVIAGCVTVWSGFTAVCGLATSFWHMLVARTGVGIGEAGCMPAATSLIADMVPKARLASALAFFTMAAPLGGVVGLGLGGLFADFLGWRNSFIVVGLLGLPVALLMLLVVRDPRVAQRASSASKTELPTFGETLALLRRKPTFWLVTAATAGKVFIGYGHATFTASFLLRNHSGELERLGASVGLAPIALVGLTLALTTGPANMLGAMVGGWLADRRGPNDPRAYLSVPAVAVVFQLPLYIPALLVGNIVLCVALLAANAFVSTFYYGPQYAAIQAVVKPQMRATATAMYGMLTTLFGLGLGPLLVGALSDYLATSGGLGPANGLRWAMIASLTFYPLTFLFFWLARSRIRTDMER